MTAQTQALVVGAGISGLTCAYALRKLGVETVVLEASERPGGVIQSTRRDGYLLEHGPQSFSGTPELHELIRELGIEEQLVTAPARALRFLLIDGRLQAAPLTPTAFFASSLFGLKTKWSVIRDLLGQSRPPEDEESLAGFVKRKFSAELLERLAGPFVSGIYAGDPDKLSLRSAFPAVYEAERGYGSVIRGMMKTARKRKGPREKPTLLSFREGNETLVRALAEKIGGNLHCASQVATIRGEDARGGNSGAKFAIEAVKAGETRCYVADHVVLATPAAMTSSRLGSIDSELAGALQRVAYAPVAVVSLGYRREDVAHSLDGFGFLVPRSAGLRTLGTVWNSSLFPGRAPERNILVTSFVGGALDTAAAGLSKEALAEMVHREIAPLLGIEAAAAFANVTTYHQAIPQYNLGHGRVQKLAERPQAPNLWLTGNYVHGPSIGACVEHALSTARAIAGDNKGSD